MSMSSATKEENQMEVSSEGLEGFFQAILPALDERQRRLLVGATARMLDGGSIARVAHAAGMSRSTVSGGLEEIAKGTTHPGRVRAPGAGRKKVIQSQPGLLAALDELIEPVGPDGPTSSLRWVDKSTAKVAEQLVSRGFLVCADTVGRLLRESGFSFKGSAGGAWDEGAVTEQFRHVAAGADARLAADEPVVSVRISQKLGAVQAGAGDLTPPSVEVANGIYALGGTEGWMPVGEEEDAAGLAVEAIKRWWQTMGIDRYPEETRLMIIAGAGGQIRRTAAWSAEFSRLAAETGLELTICHLPPGMVRWTRLEHRLFSFVTDNRPGHPLISYRTVVELGAGTPGVLLKERAELEEGIGARDVRAAAPSEIEGVASSSAPHGNHHNYVVSPAEAASSGQRSS